MSSGSQTNLWDQSAHSGDDWQKYVNRLLATHFNLQGHDYFAIPDKVHGDGGIEGFSSTGCAFQAYCDVESLSTADRAKKQKAKITQDLGKLLDSKREKFWRQLFQNTKISAWYLIVPVLEDKSVLVHARKKGEEARQCQKPFLTNDFQAMAVAANAHFPVAANVLVQNGISYLPPYYKHATESDLKSFSQARGEQILKLDLKLKKLPNLQLESKRLKARESILKRYLDSENLLASLQSTAPILWEQIEIQRQEHARNLEMQSIFDSSSPEQRVSVAKNKFCDAITSLTKSSVSTAAETIANGTIGKWLLECPLDFYEVADV